MTLRLALIIDGDPSGAKQALEDTASGMQKVEEAAGNAAAPAERLPQALKDTATEAGKASSAIGSVGEAASDAGSKMDNLKALAIGAVGGIAAGLAAEAVGWATGAVTSAVADYANSVVSGGVDVEKALTAQAELVERIKGAFNDAEGAASSYGTNTPALLRFEQQQKLSALEGTFERGQADLLSGGFFGSNAIQAGQGPAGSPLQQFAADLRAELREGEGDLIAFRNRIVELAETLPENDAGRKYAQALLEDTAQLAEVQAELAQGKDLLAGLGGNAEATANALGGTAEQYTALGESAAGALPALRETDALLRSIGGASNISRVPGTGFSVPNSSQGFAAGGYTGHLPSDQIAGFVHGREYVFDAASTARIGVGNLEAIRRGVPGYATGGYVGHVGGISSALADTLSPLRGMVADLVIGAGKAKNVWDIVGGYAERLYERVLETSLGAIESALFDGGGLGGASGGFIGDVFSSLFGGGGAQLQLGYQAGVLHGGGSVGRPPSSRFVPASLFDNAPRLHSGGSLGPKERPIIALEGEDVGFPDQLAAKYGGKVEVHVHPTAGQTATVSESDNGRGGRRMDVVLNEAVGRAISTPRGPSQQALAGMGVLAKR